MPGIFGVVAKRKPEGIEESIKKMIGKMMHEPFYHSGCYFEDSLGVWVGWTVLPESFSDCLPVSSPDGKKTLIFSGDAVATPRYGVSPLQATQNARNLMEGFSNLGGDYLREINGFFSGMLINHEESSINVFIDRFGMNRLYVYETDLATYFATEAKCILSLCPETRSFSEDGLGEFFSYGCALNGRSLFNGVNLMPGGSSWTYRKGQVEKRVYFKPEEWEAREKLTMEDAYIEIRNSFRRQLPLIMGEGKGVALSLTGGLDTRMILANVDFEKYPFPCYTFGGMYKDCYDVKVSRKVAEACKLPHQVIPLDKEFLRTFPDLAEEVVYITDGGLDLTGVPNLFVNRFAREIAPVRVTGNYGSEVLRKHRAFRPAPPDPSLFNPDFRPKVAVAESIFKTAKQGDHLTFVAFKQAPWYQYSRFALEQSQLTTRTPYMDNDFVRAMYGTSEKTSTQHNWSEQLIQDGNPMLGTIMTDRGIRLNQSFFSKAFWRPYHEFSFKMDYYSNHGMTQGMARLNHALGRFSPEKWFLGTHKYYHLRLWFRDELKGWVREILLDPKSLARPYLNRKNVELAVTAHTEGYGNHTHTINKLLTLELFQRRLLEAS